MKSAGFSGHWAPANAGGVGPRKELGRLARLWARGRARRGSFNLWVGGVGGAGQGRAALGGGFSNHAVPALALAVGPGTARPGEAVLGTDAVRNVAKGP